MMQLRRGHWAETAIRALRNGHTVQVRPKGRSMAGLIDDGDLVTLQPCCVETLGVGDVVLARIQGRRYSHIVLHLILERDGDRFLIGSHRGRVDGWVSAESILGKVARVEPDQSG